MRRFCTGEWDDAVAEAEAGLALGEEIGSHPVALAAYGVLATVAVHRDELSAAHEALAAADAILRRSGPQWSMWWMLRAYALLLEEQGDPAAGFAGLARAWDEFAEAGIAHSQLFIGPDLVRLALAVDDSARAASVTEELDRIASRASVKTGEGAALLSRGLSEGDVELILRSIAAYRESGRVREPAVAAEAAARLLSTSGRLDEALPLYDEAPTIYEQLGAS